VVPTRRGLTPGSILPIEQIFAGERDDLDTVGVSFCRAARPGQLGASSRATQGETAVLHTLLDVLWLTYPRSVKCWDNPTDST